MVGRLLVRFALLVNLACLFARLGHTYYADRQWELIVYHLILSEVHRDWPGPGVIVAAFADIDLKLNSKFPNCQGCVYMCRNLHTKRQFI